MLYCFFDGHLLKDIGMGVLFCDKCKTIFLSTYDEVGNQILTECGSLLHEKFENDNKISLN